MIVFHSRLCRFFIYSFGFLLLCFCQSTDLRAQNISGVINDYSEVLEIDTCLNQLLVANTKAFSVGDRVMIIQMKGAEIDQSNTAAFGTVTSYGNAGNYEFGTIATIQGLQITLREKIVRLYDAPKGQVQLIRVPQYTDVTIGGQVTAPAWYSANSPVGGVVVLEASGSVTLNADINVSGKGFRGGDSSSPSATPFDSSYYMPRSSASDGVKGEGIAEYPLGFETGRGPLASGGGGGDNQDGGGGGGSNSGTGGIGGDQTSLIARFPNGGLGGRPIDYAIEANHVFFGGGGGGGHENDRFATPGGDGGGIIIIRASTLIGGGGRLVADGSSARDAGVDGAGGGGAGGTIVLDVDPVPNSITLSANGGKGGNNIADTNKVPYCVAPGGGGSGGTIIVKGASVPAASLNGGNAGIIISALTPIPCKGTTYGATNGTIGLRVPNNVVTVESVLFTHPEVTTRLFTICSGDTVQFNLPGAHRIKWSPGAGLDNDAIGNPKASPTSTTHYAVSFLDGRNCDFPDSVIVTVNPKPAPVIKGSITVCTGQTFFYNTTAIPGVTYQWIVTGGNVLTGQGTENISVQWGNGTTGKIEVDVTSTSTTCSGKDSLTVTIDPILGDTLLGGGPLCAGDTMTITAQPGFAQYIWSNGDSVQSTKVTTPGNYWVQTFSAGGCTTYSDTVTVVINPIPVVTITASDTIMSDVGGIDTLTLSGKFVLNKWSTGATTDTVFITDSGTYSVTITDTNGCRATAFIHITRDLSPPEITLSFDTLAAAPCDHIIFPLRIDTSKNMPSSGATDYVTEITFDETLLAPVDKSIPSSTTGRWRTLTLNGFRPNPQVDGVLPGIEFIVALGDTIVTPIKITTFIFSNGKKVKITTYNGLFRLTKLCQQGGTRLFSEFDTLMLGNIPNPANTYTTIKYSLIEDGNTRLWVTDVLGRRCITLLDDIVKAGTYSVRLNTSSLTAGNYFYILQTPTAVLRKMMRIDR